ncbi:MAG: murein biosynthesis integral membrane protein MurJ [Candidatus Omnitrophota bacterium]
MSVHRKIAKSAGIIGIATFCSRLLGFIRDVVIARLFGVYVYAQAFVIAFKIPNLFRDLVGEGAANAAFVPVFSEYILKHSKEEFWELVNAVLNLLLVTLMAITILGVINAGFLVRLIAPGFIADSGKLAVTVNLTRIIFPYILLISLAAYSTAILNSLGHFSIPAFAPCLLNISIIICALLLGEGTLGLASGVLAGGILQLVIQIPVLYKKGFRFKLFSRFRHPAAKTIGRLMLPRLLSSCIYQLNNFVDSIFGSLAFAVGEGGVAVLYFAYRLVQFPLGVFSNSLSQAILPRFCVEAAENNYDTLQRTLSFGLRAVIFVMLPASVGLMSCAYPIVKTIFEGGKFDAYSTRMTADVLFFYSIGLFSYAATKILQACFFALKDTLTPAKISAFALGLNIILNALFMFPLKISGIALATSISGIASCSILLFILKKRIKPFAIKGIAVSFSRILAASLAMGVVCYFFNKNIVFTNSIPGKAAYIFLLIIISLSSYMVFCFMFRVKEIQELRRWGIRIKS